MNQQNQGIVSSSFDLPAKRKRGRPRKEDNQVQGDNSPVSPALSSEKKIKQAADTVDYNTDDMHGQVISGFVEGVFDAGYLLNVKVGNSENRLRGLVFLPGRIVPVTPANDVAPNVKMYNRIEVPIPGQSPQTQPAEFVPASSEPINNKQVADISFEESKFPNQVLPAEQKLDVTTTVENQSASIISFAANLQKNETGPTFGDTVLSQKGPDSEQECQAPSMLVQSKPEEPIAQDGRQQGTDVEIETETAKESEPASSIDVMQSIRNIQVENQASNSDLKTNEVVYNEVKELNNENNRTTLFAEPESMFSGPVGLTMLMQKPNVVGDQTSLSSDPTAKSSECTEISRSAAKLIFEDDQTPLVPGPAIKPSESVGISLLMEKPNFEHSRTPLVPGPAIKPSESVGISLLMEKPNFEHNHTPLGSEPDSRPSESIGISSFIEKPNINQTPLAAASKPSESLIPMVMDKPNIEDNQTPLGAEPASKPSESIGIGVLLEKPHIQDNQTAFFTEHPSNQSESIGISTLIQKPNLLDCQAPLFPQPESLPPAASLGINMFMGKPHFEDNRNLLFPEPEPLRPEPMTMDLLMEKQNLNYSHNPLIVEPRPFTSEPIEIDFHIDKQTSPRKDTLGTPSEFPYSAQETTIPMENLPVMLFDSEAAPSQPSRLENERLTPTLPQMLDPKTCSSSTTTNTATNGDTGITSSHLELSSGLNLSGSG